MRVARALEVGVDELPVFRSGPRCGLFRLDGSSSPAKMPLVLDGIDEKASDDFQRLVVSL